MSCPDWPAIGAWRDGDGVAPAGWQEALDHLAACAPCRRRVAELDPTLLLAAAAAPAPTVDEREIGNLKATVRSMVVAERLSSARPGLERRSLERPGFERRSPDRRALLAAAALVALLATPLGLSRFAERAVAPSVPPEVADVLLQPIAAPPVEEVQPAGARVYQFGTDELPVVLIFDENLDL